MLQGYIERFAGIGRLYGAAALRRLHDSHVAVVGVGGVGSWTVEALARTGVGALTLVDMDDVCISNTNRQLQALKDAGGRPKVEVLRQRVLGINPDCRVCAIQRYYTPATSPALLAPPAPGSRPYDAVADAMDSVRDKCHLLAECRRLGIPVATSGGCAGKRAPDRVRVTDLAQTGADNLLRHVRRILRHDYGFPASPASFGIPAVCSSEISSPAPCDGACDISLPSQAGSLLTPELHGRALHPNCEWGYGTAVFVSGTFGFHLAAAVVSLLLSLETA
ncbi:MAG: tRNA threonylcarbamoyladenosine dehydratase [Puniceicoccales bacterium]|jgi:tRNA A37 threonylcarbamoyladenosine dehydratase|nr:tRNA threonylcarbamoyladenosine dehydratase [Puniceicoccales bacterium]